jgi:hypothetical protein
MGDESFKNLSPNVEALKLDKQELQTMVDTMCKKTSELYLIESSQSEQDLQLQSEIDKAVGLVYSQVRAINLYLQKHEEPSSPLRQEQMNSNGTSLGSNENDSPPDDTPSNGPQQLSDTHPGSQESEETPVSANNSDSETVSSNFPSTVVAASSMDASTPSFQPLTSLSPENQIPTTNVPQLSDYSNTTVDLSHHQHHSVGTPYVSVGATQVSPAFPQYPTHTMPSYPLQSVDSNPNWGSTNVSYHIPPSSHYRLNTGTTAHYMYDAVPTISCANTTQQGPINSLLHIQPHSSSVSMGTVTKSLHSTTGPSLLPSVFINYPFTPSTQFPSTNLPVSLVSGAYTAQPAPVPVSLANPRPTS